MKTYVGFMIIVISILICMMAFTAYDAQAGGVIQNTEPSTAQKVMSAVGIFTGSKAQSDGVVNNENTVNNDGDTIYKESKFTATLDLLPFTLLTSMGGRQFSTESYVIGTMWKLDQHWQLVFQMEKLKNKSIENVEYNITHYLFGFGPRWYIADGVQMSANMGTGNSKVTRVEDGDEEEVENLEEPVWADLKILWMSDNTGYGIKIQALDMPNKAEEEENLKNYGHVMVTFSVEVGFSAISGLVQ